MSNAFPQTARKGSYRDLRARARKEGAVTGDYRDQGAEGLVCTLRDRPHSLVDDFVKRKADVMN